MKKNKIILGKTIMAAAVATSAFAVSNPADAASVSSVEKAVVKAEKLAGALKWEISIENRKVKYPKNLVGFPNMKLFNDTKAALADAKKAASSLKGKEKTIFLARLDGNVSTYLKRATAYIDAVSSGLKIQKKAIELQDQYNKGIVDSKTEGLYNEVSREIKKNAHMLDRVYGVTTRAQFRSFYKESAEKLKRNLIYPVSIKIEIDRSVQALKENKTEIAATYLGNVQFLVKEAGEKGFDKNSKIIKGALSTLNNAQNEFNKQGNLFIADSTDAAAPTTFGPATGTLTLDKTVYVYAGNNEQIKLKNLSVNGNIVVLGSPAGAGTVSLENVKVNKVNAAGGNIIVQDVADHSLHLKNVEASSVVINDTNGSNIVAEEGVKIDTLAVSEHSGTTGKTTIESKAKGSFATITLAAKGSSASEGVSLKGDFSTTVVTVTGADTKLSVEKDTQVKTINILAPVNVVVETGAVIDEVKKDPSVQGTVTVDNQGTIQKADSTVEVGGNKPVVVTQPGTVTPPGPGIVVPALTSFSAVFASGAVPGVNGKLDFPNVSDSEILSGIQFTTNTSSPLKLEVDSISARNQNLLTGPVQFDIGNVQTITTKQLFGALDTGTPGISMQNLRAVFLNEDITLKGKLIGANGAKSDVITIVINLGSGTPATSFTNEFGTITKMGLVNSKHKIQVTINPNKANVKLSDIIAAPTNVDFASFLVAYSMSAVLVDPELIPTNVEELKAKIRSLIENGTFGDVKLGQLKGKTFSTSSITVEFN